MVMDEPSRKSKPASKRSSYFETLSSVTSQLDFLLTDLGSSDALFSPMSPLDLGRNVQSLQSADFLFHPPNQQNVEDGYKRLPSSADEQKTPVTGDVQSSQPDPQGYTDVFTFKPSPEPTIIEEEPLPAISMRTRLFYTKPVWFLPNIHRPAAVHYLQGQPTGTFIVRSSSRPGVLCLSMKHPGTSGGAYIEHFNIIALPNGYRLDHEEDVYGSLDELILHHCSHRETLPCTLQLPHALETAQTGAELQSFAILEQEFWKSPHSRAHSHQHLSSKTSMPPLDDTTSFMLSIQSGKPTDDLMDTRDTKERILSLYENKPSRPNSRHSWSSDTSSDQWIKPVYGHRRSSSDANRQIMRYSNEAGQLDLSYLKRHPPPTCPPPLPPVGGGIPFDISADDQHPPLDSHQTVIPRSNGHYNQVRALSSDGSSVRSQSTISEDSLFSMGRDSTCSSLSSRQSNSSLPPFPPSRLSEQFSHQILSDQPCELETQPILIDIDTSTSELPVCDPPKDIPVVDTRPSSDPPNMVEINEPTPVVDTRPADTSSIHSLNNNNELLSVGDEGSSQNSFKKRSSIVGGIILENTVVDGSSLEDLPQISVQDINQTPLSLPASSSRNTLSEENTGSLISSVESTIQPSSTLVVGHQVPEQLPSDMLAPSNQNFPHWVDFNSPSNTEDSKPPQCSSLSCLTTPGMEYSTLDPSLELKLSADVLDEIDLDLSVLEFRGSIVRRKSWNPPAVSEFDPLLIEPPPEFKDDYQAPDDTDGRDGGGDLGSVGQTRQDIGVDGMVSGLDTLTDVSAMTTGQEGVGDAQIVSVTEHSTEDTLVSVTGPIHTVDIAPTPELEQSKANVERCSSEYSDEYVTISNTLNRESSESLQRSSSEWSGEVLTANEGHRRGSVGNILQSSSDTTGADISESLPVSLVTSDEEDIQEGEVEKRMERCTSLPNALTRGTNQEGVFQSSRSALFIKDDASRESSLAEEDFEIIDQETWNSENVNSNRSLEGVSGSAKHKKGRKFGSQLKFMAKKSSKKVHKKLKPTWSKKLEIHNPAASIQAVVKRLAGDKSTRLGAMMDSFIKTTIDKCENHPPDAVLKSIRQFMSGVKNYLFLDQEPEIVVQLDKYCDLLGMEVDAIFEGALHQILLGPLRDQIYLCFIRHFNECGSLTLLDRNFRAAKEKIPLDLGIKTNFIPPSPSSLLSIKDRFTEIQRAFSPIQKLEYLLRVVREIYSSVSDTCLGRNAVTSMGADDFLPMLIYVLVHCDQIHIEIEVEYMWGLLDPSLLSGEGGYYLTTLSSAICVLKQLEEETECETKGLVTVFVARSSQPGDIIMKTVPVLPAMTSVEVCNVVIQKLNLDTETPHHIFLLSDGKEQALESHCSIYKIKTDYESMENRLCKFCIRPENITVNWPVISTNLKGSA